MRNGSRRGKSIVEQYVTTKAGGAEGDGAAGVSDDEASAGS